MRGKKIFFLICVFFLSLIIINHEPVHASKNSTTIKVNTEKYVNVKGGLILRDAPNSQGKKVTMLKNGSKVFVYTTDGNGWSFVKQGNLKGYAKDSYLIIKSQNNTNKKKRVVDFSMSVNQVKKMEPAKLKQQLSGDGLTFLIYDVNKYGYYSELIYYFKKGKLTYIIYDFLPEKDSYNTWNEMERMFNQLDKKAVNEFGKGSYVSDNFSYLGKMWKLKNYSVMLRVDDDNYYTSASLVYYK